MALGLYEMFKEKSTIETLRNCSVDEREGAAFLAAVHGDESTIDELIRIADGGSVSN